MAAPKVFCAPMLRHLDIRDMLIIDRLAIEFQPGLNVLTGETGAGKSILLDALGFVLGWRGRADLVRVGTTRAEVAAVFDLPPDHPAKVVLQEAGLPMGDELILRRVNTPEGRKTAWINDRRTSGEVLRALSDTLVELHGQHDDKGLLDPKQHRTMLDTFGGYTALVAEVRVAWRHRRQAIETLNVAEAKLATTRAEEEFLRHAVAELDEFAPQIGEETSLDTRRRLMRAAERLREDVARATHALGPDGAEGAMGDARRWIEDVADKAEGRLDRALEALERAVFELSEAQSDIDGFAAELLFNPNELEEVAERLFALRGLARKHDITPDDLPEFANGLRAKLVTLDNSASALADLITARDQAEAAYTTAAAQLTKARAEAAAQLDAAVVAELGPLKMDRAIFHTTLAETSPGPEGAETVTFRVSTNLGAPAGPLNRIASGGELSRFMLALKVCLTRGAQGMTMIFDEIDRGVGGATADAVGRRLATLGQNSQILIVTHSPQVAALGQHHWQVTKSTAQGMTTSQIVPLDPADRVDEVARMLSGDTITDAARDAARALLSDG